VSGGHGSRLRSRGRALTVVRLPAAVRAFYHCRGRYGASEWKRCARDRNRCRPSGSAAGSRRLRAAARSRCGRRRNPTRIRARIPRRQRASTGSRRGCRRAAAPGAGRGRRL